MGWATSVHSWGWGRGRCVGPPGFPSTASLPRLLPPAPSAGPWPPLATPHGMHPCTPYPPACPPAPVPHGPPFISMVSSSCCSCCSFTALRYDRQEAVGSLLDDSACVRVLVDLMDWAVSHATAVRAVRTQALATGYAMPLLAWRGLGEGDGARVGWGGCCKQGSGTAPAVWTCCARGGKWRLHEQAS